MERKRFSPEQGNLEGGLTAAIANLPQCDVPSELLAGVMSRVKPRRAPWWKRALNALVAPLVFEVSPARLAPAAMLLVACLAYLFSGPGQQPGAHLAAITPEMPGHDAPVGQVVFTLRDEQAASVALVGSFNDWSPGGYAMTRDESAGVWRLAVPLDSGRHEYAFMVDGDMVADPRAVLQTDDGFGNTNSILIVRESAHEIHT
jgi:hypothetical protein